MQDLHATSSPATISPAPSWTEEQILAAWNQGQIAERFNPDKWRKDPCGAWIARQQFGNKQSNFGWEIDAVALEAGGVNGSSSVLRPLQWKNASAKTNDKLVCAVIAHGGENISVR
jgi:hypothetical protein